MSPPISPYEDGGAGALPTVVIVHGGFFKDKWSARNTQTASLVPFLLERGLAVGVVEYRRRGGVDAEEPRPPEARRYCRRCALGHAEAQPKSPEISKISHHTHLAVEYRRRGGVDAERPRLASTLRVHGVHSQCTECTIALL